jgi:2-polyprenyl-6-methoxyphenol hydroxylase-like FAD-dependent oxidoreductase
MLGRKGRSVAVCERWTSRYPLPRAVCVDHELYRVLSANGMGEVLPSVTHGGPLYQWFNADWKELLVIDWQKASISGGPEVNFVHQPTLEGALDTMVQQQKGVDLHLGWEAVAVTQDADLAHVTLRHVETGEEKCCPRAMSWDVTVPTRWCAPPLAGSGRTAAFRRTGW